MINDGPENLNGTSHSSFMEAKNSYESSVSAPCTQCPTVSHILHKRVASAPTGRKRLQYFPLNVGHDVLRLKDQL